VTAAGTEAPPHTPPGGAVRLGVVTRIRARATLLAASAGHLGSDFSQGAIPAMLPFLREHRGYSYSQGTALVLAMSLGASLAQPPFGHLVDRRRIPALAPLGVLLAASSIALVGFVSSYALLFAVIVIGGLGVAAFHPEGARTAARASGERRAAGMSVFAVGGNIGFALAPAIVAGVLALAGLHGTALVALVPLTCAATLAIVLARRREALAAAEVAAAKRTEGEDLWGPFWRLAISACLRSGVYFVLIAPSLLLALAVGEWLAYPVLAIVGFVTIASMSVTVVMGQEYLPNRLGTASGVMLGLVISIGGGIVAALGPLADATSARTVLFALCALPLLSILLVLRLPESNRR